MTLDVHTLKDDDSGQVNYTLVQLLKHMLEVGASDLHLSKGSPPRFRVHGRLKPLNLAPLTASGSKRLAYSVLNEGQKQELEEEQELDFSFGVAGLARFRVNLFNARGAIAGAYRMIPESIPNLRDLGIPDAVAKLCEKPRGLVLVTGPTGSGKSTTMAAMVSKLNHELEGHILTIEDPIEFMHASEKCLINQRELHSDTQSFGRALRSALREDPDVVLVGEMRDQETIQAALRIAETGHLTLGTLHTNSASQTITRIIDVFPAEQQEEIRTQLSIVLEGVMCQALLPRIDGKGRCIALEVMIPDTGIRNLIRQAKIEQIYGRIQAGQERTGMQTFDQSLYELVYHRLVSPESALTTSQVQVELERMITANKQPAGSDPSRMAYLRRRGRMGTSAKD